MFHLLLLALSLIPQFGGTCGCEDKPQVNTLAVVNGVKITKQELGSDARNKVTLLQSAVIKARAAELDRQVNQLLIEAEAKKRGLTPEQLVQVEVLAKAPEPTEAEVRAYYDERKQHINEDFKKIRPQIVTLMRVERERLEAIRFTNSLRVAADVTVVDPNVTPPVTEQELNRVFVFVNGRPISSRDIETNLMPLIFSVQQQVYAVRKQDLDRRINDLLLEDEAKRRGTTPAALLATEVRTKLPIITDQEAKTYYAQNKSKLGDSFDKVKFQIIGFLLAEEEQKVANDFAMQLRQNAAVQVYLTPPESPAFKISTDDQPIRGNANAAVTVVQFTDFECAACAKQQEDISKLVGEFESQVKFVVRDFPLAQDPNAEKAAEAAEAAREQGKYWEYVSLLYANQSALQVDDLKKYASRLGLDRKRFDAALDSGQFRSRVSRDIDDGTRLAINGAPAVFVNGKRVSDTSYEGLKAAIAAALKRR